VHPKGTWLFCRALVPAEESEGGLILAKDFDKDVRSEGVAEVLAVGEGRWSKDGRTLIPNESQPGDYVVYRGFLRYAQQWGDLIGADKGSRFFLMHQEDALATLEGPCVVGELGEYRIP
jgi:co-chaperonin GroES (HSP10)